MTRAFATNAAPIPVSGLCPRCRVGPFLAFEFYQRHWTRVHAPSNNPRVLAARAQLRLRRRRHLLFAAWRRQRARWPFGSRSGGPDAVRSILLGTASDSPERSRPE